MTAYPDSSVLVPLYVPDSHTPAAVQLMGQRPQFWLTPLHIAEFTHAVERHVFLGRLAAASARAVHEVFARNLAAGAWLRGEVPAAAFERCAELARRYAARLNPRTLDSLHVACALELGARAFWTFDGRQAGLARAVGLAVSGVA